MSTLARVLVAVVAIQHVLFLVLECFLWERTLGKRMFPRQPELARATSALAKNQGVYNGFLAAGLVWALVEGSPPIACFFLVCVVVAGVAGAVTVSPRIAVVQSIPAIAALAAVWW